MAKQTPLRVTITVEPELHRKLANTAELMNVSLGELMRQGGIAYADAFLTSKSGRRAAQRKMKQMQDMLGVTADEDDEDDE